MTPIEYLENLLKEQFGPFIRNADYKKAFDQAMLSIKGFEQKNQNIDIFYLFLHHLIIELFDEIEKLNQKLNKYI